MSGHGVTDLDAKGLVYFARRLREETHGCSEWQEPGIVAAVAEMKGWNLATALEQVLRRATDPGARTPKAMLHSMASAPLPSQRPKGDGPPPQTEECPKHLGQSMPPFCGPCNVEAFGAETPPSPNLLAVEKANPALAARLKALTGQEDA